MFDHQGGRFGDDKMSFDPPGRRKDFEQADAVNYAAGAGDADNQNHLYLSLATGDIILGDKRPGVKTGGNLKNMIQGYIGLVFLI